MDSTFRPALMLMSGRVVASLATFFIPVVLVRIFEPAEFGTYKQLFLIAVTFYSIAQLGMAESLFYFLPSIPRHGGRYVLNAILLLAGAGVACLGLLVMAGPAVARWLNNGNLPGYLTLIGVYVLLTLVSSVLEIVMIARKRYLQAAVAYAVSDVSRAVLLIVPALVIRELQWLLFGAVAFAGLRFVATLVYMGREFDGELKPDAALLTTQWVYTLPFALAVIAEIVQANLHQYAVSYYFDAATFAVYAVGCLQIPFIDFVTGSAANVMMVRMSDMIKDGRGDEVPAVWHDATRKLALIFFPLVGLLLVTAHELIVFLFTENYRASVPLFMIWTTSIVLTILLTDGVLRVYAETRFLLTRNLIRLLLIASTIHWFLSAFHLAGAALVTIFATIVTKVISLARIKRLWRVGLSQLLPWRNLAAIFAASAAAGLSALLVKSALELTELPLLLATGMAYAASYLALLWRFNVLHEGEKLTVAAWLQRLPVGTAKAGELQQR